MWTWGLRCLWEVTTTDGTGTVWPAAKRAMLHPRTWPASLVVAETRLLPALLLLLSRTLLPPKMRTSCGSRSRWVPWPRMLSAAACTSPSSCGLRCRTSWLPA